MSDRHASRILRTAAQFLGSVVGLAGRDYNRCRIFSWPLIESVAGLDRHVIEAMQTWLLQSQKTNLRFGFPAQRFQTVLRTFVTAQPFRLGCD